MDSTATPSAELSTFLAEGRISAANDGIVIFHPTNTTYELHLICPDYRGPIGTPVKGRILAEARKIWSVPSGGLFITPIQGRPKIVQGRVRQVENDRIALHAGTRFIIQLPPEDSAIELANGAFGTGAMVNCTLLPGARFELA
jgi:hypothetical protein